MDKEAMKKAAAKKAAAEEKRMAAILKAQNDALMQSSVTIKQKEVPPGVDPKSVVCEFFRANRCNKGNKCKFAHDLKAELKVAKINVFEDVRDAKDTAPTNEADTMDDWDVDKLAQVVDSKQDVANRNLPTKIVCKHFLEAIENNKYGWFWECPNGGKKCMYRHALPEGYVLKRDRKRLEEEKEKGPTLEELIERERNKIGVGTPVNDATFAAWMRRKRRAAARKRLQDAAAREAAIKQGKEKMSGREAFTQNPNMHHADDDGEEGDEFDATELKDDEPPADGAVEAPDDTPMKVWETNEYELREDDEAADAADLAILHAAKAEAKAKYDAMSAQRAKDKAENGDDDDDDDDADDNDDNDDNDDDDDDNNGNDDDDDNNDDDDNDAGDDNADDDDDGNNNDDDNDNEGTQKAASSTAAASSSSAAPAPAIDASVFAGQNLDELPDFSDDDEEK